MTKDLISELFASLWLERRRRERRRRDMRRNEFNSLSVTLKFVLTRVMAQTILEIIASQACSYSINTNYEKVRDI